MGKKKYLYKTIDLRTPGAKDYADSLQKQGWVIMVSSIYSLTLQKKNEQ